MPRRKRPCTTCPNFVGPNNKTGRCVKCLGRKHPGHNGPVAERREVDSIEETANQKTITKVVNQRVRTLEDLVRVCEIDRDEWDIKWWKCGKWEVGMKLETRTAEGKILSSEPHTEELFQVSAVLTPKSVKDKTLKLLSEQLLRDIREECVDRKVTDPKSFVASDGKYLFEFAPFDLHMGKYAWGEETVTDYDLDSSTDLFNASIDFLLDRAMRLTDGKLDRILCVFGNDVSHIDSKRAQTTAGTPMDADTRYIKIYRRICEIHRRAVNILKAVAPVDVVVVAGNHDELTSFHLGEILSAVYEQDPFVTVDNGARMRKYYEYGVNLFGFTHGDAERVSELPLTMAREMPQSWARCSSREWHIGHKHISEKMSLSQRPLEQDFFSDKGVRVRRLTSLSAHDAWHTKHAYMDRRACESFVFHKTAGFTDHLSFNVDHFSGKALKV